MAAVEYADLVKTVSGALTKINKKSQHAKDQKMVLGTHRVAATTSPNCSHIYLRGFGAVIHKSAQTPESRAARNRFGTVAIAVAARKANLSTLTADQQAFLAQKDQPLGKKTFRAYLWKVCGDEYDAQYGG